MNKGGAAVEKAAQAAGAKLQAAAAKLQSIADKFNVDAIETRFNDMQSQIDGIRTG